MTSVKPYLVRAVYEWITDNSLTPYILVNANAPGTVVPAQYVKDGMIILNIAFQVVHELLIGNEQIEFKARFSGVPHQIYVPLAAIQAIYAKENGQGLRFDEEMIMDFPPEDDSGSGGDDGGPSTPPKGQKPNLRIVK